MSWKVEIVNIGPNTNPKHPKSWIIRGWYEEEKDLYLLVESDWNKLQKSGPFYSGNGSDYFMSHVTIFVWFLHKDGSWHKKLSNSEEEQTGRYDTWEIASSVLSSVTNIPERYVDYEGHLRSAQFPSKLISHSESVHNI